MTDPQYGLPSATCALCGEPAKGYATVNDVRYCHGDDDPSPTCYMRVRQADMSTGAPTGGISEPTDAKHCYGCTNDATVLCEEIKRLREALEMIAEHRDLSGPTAGAYVAKEALKHSSRADTKTPDLSALSVKEADQLPGESE